MDPANLLTKWHWIVRTGGEEAGNGAVLAEPCHRFRMDARSLHTDRKDGATGIDGVTAQEYEANLVANLKDLLKRIKSGRYEAPPVRRTYIPKADGSQRPLGIPMHHA